MFGVLPHPLPCHFPLYPASMLLGPQVKLDGTAPDRLAESSLQDLGKSGMARLQQKLTQSGNSPSPAEADTPQTGACTYSTVSSASGILSAAALSARAG